MILYTKSWHPKSDIFISDLEKIDNIKLEPFKREDGHWVMDPPTTIITYHGFNDQELDRLLANHAHPKCVRVPSPKPKESLFKKIKSELGIETSEEKRKKMDALLDEIKPYVETNPRISLFNKHSFNRYELARFKSSLIEYLTYELGIEFSEGSVG